MKNSTKGFTLLELLIAISILAALMLYSNQSIQNGMRAKVRIQEQTDLNSSVRDALRVMEKDINLAMHYRDLESEFKQAVQKSSSATPTPNPIQGTAGGAASGAGSGGSATSTTTQQQAQAQQALQQAMQVWMAKDPRRVDPTTDFVGASDELHFITMNAPKLSEDSAQADFVKVGYYLADCKKPGDTGHTSKCLFRSSDSLAEGDVTKNGASVVLLEHVKEFKLRYINVNKQDWVGDWSSKSADAGMKLNFPDSVEISLKIETGEGDKKKTVGMRLVAPIRFPNNAQAANNANGQPQPPGPPATMNNATLPNSGPGGL